MCMTVGNPDYVRVNNYSLTLALQITSVLSTSGNPICYESTESIDA